MKKIKQILIKGTIESNGIVNYDSVNQKFALIRAGKIGDDETQYMLPSLPINKDDGKIPENILFGKKNIEFDTENNIVCSRLKISSGLLRHEIFKDVPMVSPIISNDKLMMTTYMLSRTGMARGFMFTVRKNSNNDGKGQSFAKKSALTITDAVQVNNALSHIEIFNDCGSTDETSMFYKETAGKVVYEFTAIIDLKTLRFLSCDPKFGRMAMHPDSIEKMVPMIMKSHFGPDVKYTVGGYTDVGALVGKSYAEYGIYFSDEVIKDVVKYILKNMLEVRVLRTSGTAWIPNIEVMPVRDVLEDKFESSNIKWSRLMNAEDINNFCLNELDEIEEFYEKVSDKDIAKATELYKLTEKNREASKNINK